MGGDGVRQISRRSRQNRTITAGACSGANSLSQRQEKGMMREQVGESSTFTLNAPAKPRCGARGKSLEAFREK